MLDLDTGDRKKIYVSTCPPGTDRFIVLFFQGKTKRVSSEWMVYVM